MTKRITPLVCFCVDDDEARALAAEDPSGDAMTADVGPMVRSVMIAEHGAGQLERIYTSPSTIGKWRAPVGTVAEFTLAFRGRHDEETLKRCLKMCPGGRS